MTGNPNTTYRVLREVLSERALQDGPVQDGQWGGRNHPDGTADRGDRDRADFARHQQTVMAGRGLLAWRDILNTQVRETFAESDPAVLRAKLVHVAAFAVAWIEAIDRRNTASLTEGAAR
ncbi:hypothetical protein OG352_05515 [Streptomyces sp. NBC_01485]|uniref:hypothetical protein n=1 Tax=Streptomyces sp. NBC_01485 TaxID=2903884 RepID=UPI002E380CD8|nr:hypothetical protein [Streptomyces sp. NBC_01485]